MDLRNLLLLTTIYLLSSVLYSKKEYQKCDSLLLKIKRTILSFGVAFIKDKNKWIKEKILNF